MSYKIKRSVGRPSEDYKLRRFEAIAPKGYKFHGVSHKKQGLIYKKQ